MTLRKLLTNFGLYALCVATGAEHADLAADAAGAATSVARSLVVGERIDFGAFRTWKDRLDIDCVCFPHDSPPVAPACAND